MKAKEAKKLKVGQRVYWKTITDLGTVTQNGPLMVEIKWDKLEEKDKIQRLHHVDCVNVWEVCCLDDGS